MRRAAFAAALAAALLLGACTRGDGRTLVPPTTSSVEVTTPDRVVEGEPTERAEQPQIVLTDGNPQALRAEPIPVVDGEPLTPDEVDTALGRVPEWEFPDDGATDFSRPAERLDPPVPGETIETPFPPPVETPPPGVDDPAPGPLHVVRFQPEGEVATAPFLSVTFDQPMVPVATVDQLAAEAVPVELTPPVEGRWRWIGTRTLRFEVVPGAESDGSGVPDRLPAATEYTVRVPAGTTSANGAVLGDDVTWTFATPAPIVTVLSGIGDSMPLNPVFVATFDQRVDPAAVLATVRVTADGEAHIMRLATGAEVESDEQARATAAGALAGRVVAFTPESPLPADAAIVVEIGPGTPSLEGRRTTGEVHSVSGRTFAALRVDEHGCFVDGGCRPGDTFHVVFNNPLATQGVGAEQAASLVSVEPAIRGAEIRVHSSGVDIAGATQARTTYTVTLSGAIADVHGQTLGEPVELEFRVGSADPALHGFSRDFVTVDPMADTPTVSIGSVNHESVHVTAWAVTPADATEFGTVLENMYADRPVDPPWPVVMDADVTIEADDDEFVETFVDLSDAFAQSAAHLVVSISPTRQFSRDSDEWWQNRPTIAWVQRTTLGLDAFTDGRQLVIWTTDLTTGDPVGGVPVELLDDGRLVTTDDDGLATVELTSARIRGLVANAGDASALLVTDWWSGWARGETPDESRWYVVDDRGVYRPGETLRAAGWVRRMGWVDDAQLGLFGEAEEHTIDYVVYDAYGVEVGRGSTPTNALGGFNLTAELPAGVNLGQGWVDLRVNGAGVGPNNGYLHYFAIQEYRRPEFEVTTRAESPPPYYAADPATVAVDAAYYAGGPLPNAEVQWLISTSESSYAPPGWDDFRFGVYTPWWWAPMLEGGAAEVDFGCFEWCPGAEPEFEQFSGRTNADGTHYLEIAFGASDEIAIDLPRSVSAEATVFDVNRQAWSDRTELLVHPAEQYVGLRSDRSFVEQGTPIRISAIVTDVDGAVVAGRPVEVTAGRVTWAVTNGEWEEQLTDVQTCTFDSADETHECEFATPAGGEYRITAVVTDGTGGRNRTEMTVWVAGGTGRPTRDVDEQAVTIVPSTDEFAPGTTAELLVQAPFAPATGSYTVSHGGIRETRTFAAPDGSAVLEIPIESADVPTLNVAIEMVGTAPRTNDDGTPAEGAAARPAYATGRVALPVPPVERTLTVTATPAADVVEPGRDTSVTVSVSGPDGAPVAGADVALVVVDEAVLALSGFELADPLGVFYAPLPDTVWATYGRGSIVLTRADRTGAVPGSVPAVAPAATELADTEAGTEFAADGDSAERATAGAATAQDEAASQVEVRENFDAVALFEPAAVTGTDGTVTVDVSLPDTLTRYRVMAVAVGGATDFGKGESSITAGLPLMARPSAPRFLNFGDRFELPVVLQNQTDQDLELLVALETDNLTLTGPVGKRVVVPAADRVEVRFAAAAEAAGTARYRVVAVSGDPALGYADAVAGELPVYTPATTEAFATYGVLDGSGDPAAPAAVGQPVLAPTEVIPEFGGLELTTSSTALSALTDAVLYVVDYPYQSSDALAGRIISIATLREVLEAFGAEGLPSPDELDRRVADDITTLVQMQNADGGWGWFANGRPSDPWLSVTATHALVLARAEGYAVPQAGLDSALGFLSVIEEHIPEEWGPEARTAVRSYALYVRNEAGAGDPAKAADVYREAGEALELDAMAWLWPSIDDAGIRDQIERTLANRAVDTPGAVTFATDYGEQAYLIAHSDRRTDAVVLDGLITETPGSDLVEKTALGLVAGQTRGRWSNLYENTFALVALHRYFETFESVTPDFVARAWLGPEYVVEHAFSGRSPDRSHTLVPMQELIDTAGSLGAAPLVVANDGVGRLYYRVGVRYAPASLELEPRDEGFVVDRVYEAVDDPADVTRDEDGTWHIRAGATVRVRLTMLADAVRTHVGLVDPLPAGLEAVNPALDTSQTIVEPVGAEAPRACCWGWWRWYEHENLGDDRVEAFASYLAGGTYEYEYFARATTPGEFVVPPTRAEQIYAPEVFGRSASARLVVDG